MMEETIWIAHTSKLIEGVPIFTQAEGLELVVLKYNGSITVFQGVCPHEGTLLATGTVDKGMLICSGHGWRFDCASGQKVEEPSVCLKRFSVRIEQDHVGVQRTEVIEWQQMALQQSNRSTPVLQRRSLKDLPGPKGLPLVGNLLQLDVKQLHLILERWANQHGPIYTFKMGAQTVVAIADPDLMHAALRNRPEAYRRIATVAPVFEEMGMTGVFSEKGQDWYRQRRVAMHALNISHLSQFFPTIAKVTARLKTRWDRAAAAGDAVDLQSDLMRFAVDVTTDLAFGYDINTLEEKGDVLQPHLEQIMPMLNRRVFAPFPYWHFVKLPADRALDRALAALHKVIASLIAQSRNQLADNPELAARPSNLLQAMLAVRDEKEAFTEEEIAGNVLTFLVAGEDTTANTMSWMAHYMTADPQIEQHMQQEADEVLGNSSVLQHFPDHERLTYLEAVAHETLRLKAVVPILFIEANHAVELGGIHLPAGTSVVVLPRLSGLQESAFSAAQQFRPERWLTGSARPQSGHNPSAIMPFGSGPRYCPGRNLALLEIKSVMAMLCHNFSISKIADSKQVGEQFAFVMMPTNVLVNFRRREESVSA